jgi:hypothetical protein
MTEKRYGIYSQWVQIIVYAGYMWLWDTRETCSKTMRMIWIEVDNCAW